MVSTKLANTAPHAPQIEERYTAANNNKIRLFPAAGPLESILMDLLGPFPNTTYRNNYFLVIKDRYSKLTRETSLKHTKASCVVQAFVTHWFIPYEAPATLFTENGTQFTGKFFSAVCVILVTKHLTTTSYHPHTNVQTD